MGNQSSARLSGDEYQHLYSWYEILNLLDPESPYDHAFVEHPAAGAADDITLHPAPGTTVPTRFIQVKWHVDHRKQYGFESLVEITSGTRSLLQKLFDSWRKLRGAGPLEVWLVSNWAVDMTLGAFLTDGRALRPELLTSRSRVVRAGRDLWLRELDATQEELGAFCQDLRFELSFASESRLETHVDDRMRGYGLQHGPDARGAAVNEIRRRIRNGDDRQITRSDLLRVIDTLRLRADTEATPGVTLAVHGWVRVPVSDEHAVERDWLSYFDRAGRGVATPQDWEATLLPALHSAREQIVDMSRGSFIDFKGKVPLTVALAVGFAFPQVGGFSFRVEQPTGHAVSLWSSSEVPSNRRFIVTRESGSAGPDVVVGLGVSGDGLPDIERYAGVMGADALVYAEPDSGTGQAILEGASDAVALAASAKELIRKARATYGANRVHLIVFCPATLALFIGQTLNALGTIVTYERDGDGAYQPSATLETG